MWFPTLKGWFGNDYANIVRATCCPHALRYCGCFGTVSWFVQIKQCPGEHCQTKNQDEANPLPRSLFHPSNEKNKERGNIWLRFCLVVPRTGYAYVYPTWTARKYFALAERFLFKHRRENESFDNALSSGFMLTCSWLTLWWQCCLITALVVFACYEWWDYLLVPCHPQLFATFLLTSLGLWGWECTEQLS